MNDVESLFAEMGDDWASNEPIDFPTKKISDIYDDMFLDIDAQNYADWMKRVAEHFPMLYFSMQFPSKE